MVFPAHEFLDLRVSVPGLSQMSAWVAVVVLIAASWVFRAEGFSLPPNPRGSDATLPPVQVNQFTDEARIGNGNGSAQFTRSRRHSLAATAEGRGQTAPPQWMLIVTLNPAVSCFHLDTAEQDRRHILT